MPGQGLSTQMGRRQRADLLQLERKRCAPWLVCLKLCGERIGRAQGAARHLLQHRMATKRHMHV